MDTALLGQSEKERGERERGRRRERKREA